MESACRREASGLERYCAAVTVRRLGFAYQANEACAAVMYLVRKVLANWLAKEGLPSVAALLLGCCALYRSSRVGIKLVFDQLPIQTRQPRLPCQLHGILLALLT
jgi:hypothetical protein